MAPRLGSTAGHDDEGGGRRTLVAAAAGALVLAVVAIPLALAADGGDDPGPSGSPEGGSRSADPPARSGTSPDGERRGGSGGGAIPFDRFPLDRGWEEIHGRNAIDGPGRDTGGISMPEGHCDEEVLFGSGYEEKLSTHVATHRSSLTREILGYPDAGTARSVLRALDRAVAGCAVLTDPATGRRGLVAEVHEEVDAANAGAGVTTLTFAYASTGPTRSGVLYQFAVVDDVLYGSSHHGRWAADTATAGVAALDEANAPLTALLSRVER